MASRNKYKLRDDLRERWEYLKSKWHATYPNRPQPFLTCTHRGETEQEMLYREGKTNARYLQSLHNFEPALAFDIAMGKHNGSVEWQDEGFIYSDFAQMAKAVGLEWGGDWNTFFDDIYHFQIPTTWQKAQGGNVPPLPPLEDTKLNLAEISELLSLLQGLLDDILETLGSKPI